MFTKFGQDAASGLRVQESDVQTLSALAWSLVDETDAFLADLGQSLGYTVLYAECYMVHTLVALVEPLLDGTLG